MSKETKQRLSIAIGVVWFLGTAIPLGYLMGFHLNAFPLPGNQGMRTVAHDFRQNLGRWEMIHVLGADCACSERLVSYLSRRGNNIGDIDESVIIAGENPRLAHQLEQSGFNVRSIDPELIYSRYELHGLPVLFILNPKGEIMYSGGYAERRSSVSLSSNDDAIYKDKSILNYIRQGKKTEISALPIWGCANGEKIRKSIDPLGLKYKRKKSYAE